MLLWISVLYSMVSDFAFVHRVIPTFDDIDTGRRTFGVNDFVKSLLDGK